MKILVDKQTPCELQYVGLPIIDHEVCKKTETGKTFLRSTNKELPDVQLCAGHLEGGKDACQVSFGKRIVHKLLNRDRCCCFKLLCALKIMKNSKQANSFYSLWDTKICKQNLFTLINC